MTCACGCGQETAIAKKTNIRDGATKGQPLKFVHGHNRKGLVSHFKHGMQGSSEQRAFIEAKYRCTNPNAAAYKDYGGRGIEFRFESFKQFFDELGPRPEGMTLDRKDNNGNYEPGNVRWATWVQQNNNRRERKTHA